MTLTIDRPKALSETEGLPDSLKEKIVDAERIIREALEIHQDEHEIVAQCVLFSGGNDSSTLLDLAVRMGVVTHAIHANTTIGIEATRQFVRDRCADMGIPLMEEYPPTSYAELVEDQGFPGPGHHFKMYQRLKERCLRQARKKLVINPRKQRVLFIAGRRRAESARRSDIPENERQGSVIWASPLANWTKDDLNLYREHFEVPRNTVADNLGMSGECLCGAFAEPGEMDRIRHYHPEVADEIEELEVRLLAKGKIPEARCMWGWGAYKTDDSAKPSKSGPLCSSCDFRSDPTKRLNLDAESEAKVQEAFERIQARRAARRTTTEEVSA